jgi:uncharacterized protein involved in outer membrane biogenesis
LFLVNTKEQAAQKKGKILQVRKIQTFCLPIFQYAPENVLCGAIMKWLKWIGIPFVLLIIIAAAIVYFSLDSIIKGAIERQATASLGVPTTLGSVRLSLFGGSFDMNDLAVASPPKFSAPHIFTLNGAGLRVRLGQLTSSPIHIQHISIDHPVVVVEQSELKLNLNALYDQMPTTPKTSGNESTSAVKVIIDQLDLNNAQVTLMPGVPGVTQSIDVPVNSVTLKNIGNAGGNGNGAAIRDVVMQAATALTIKAVDASKLPPEVKIAIAQNLNVLALKLGPDFNNQYKDLAGSLVNQLPPKVQDTVNSVLKGLQDATGKK